MFFAVFHLIRHDVTHEECCLSVESGNDGMYDARMLGYGEWEGECE